MAKISKREYTQKQMIDALWDKGFDEGWLIKTNFSYDLYQRMERMLQSLAETYPDANTIIEKVKSARRLIDEAEDILAEIENDVAKDEEQANREFEDRSYYASTKKSNMKKTPIMQTYFGHDEDHIDLFNRGSEITVDEINRLAPHASVVPGIGAIDVIWYLPSGNHPGLWITTHGKGRQGVHITARHFDYPDEEGISGFLDYMQDRYGHPSYELVNNDSGLPVEEIRQAIIDMEERLGPIASEPRGEPLYASTKKSKMKKDLDVEGRFDDYRQEPHGKYVLHLNLNGDSFYPKYYDDEESFNRDVQSAIDGGYTESENSNYSDSEGLHRRFWKDTWSTKKSKTESFNSMVNSIRVKNNKKKVL